MPDANCRDNLRGAGAPKFACRKSGKEHHQALGHCSKKAKATERGAEDFQFDSGKERGYGRVRNVAPVEVASIGVGQQLIPVETVLAVKEGT